MSERPIVTYTFKTQVETPSEEVRELVAKLSEHLKKKARIEKFFFLTIVKLLQVKAKLGSNDDQEFAKETIIKLLKKLADKINHSAYDDYVSDDGYDIKCLKLVDEYVKAYYTDINKESLELFKDINLYKAKKLKFTLTKNNDLIVMLELPETE